MNFDDICKIIGRLYLDSNLGMEKLQKEIMELKEQLKSQKPTDVPKDAKKAS